MDSDGTPIEAVRSDARVERATAFLRADDERTLASQVELSEIPAPPFQEDLRAGRMAALMREAGIEDVRSDAIGNVVGHRPGRDASKRPLVVSAHLDTVFPPGTDVTVQRRGDRLQGPGISDDARGLATLLAVARALRAGGLTTDGPLLFVATVGEEGAGDLRGVKHLFSDEGAAGDCGAFISLDGAGLDRIVSRGLGSRRYRITAQGQGGHSWVDRGTPNPIHFLASVADRLALLPLPRDPATALTIARWGGGKSINAIPQEAWIELDTRSVEAERLSWLESEVRRSVTDFTAGSSNGLELRVDVIGDRPGGTTPTEANLVQAALAATRCVGADPILVQSSTDANIPMSKGVPAITLGCGGAAGQAHTTEEWYRNTRGVDGLIRAVYTILMTAGLTPVT